MESYNSLQFWIGQAKLKTNEETLKIIVGNKLDLKEDRINTEEAAKEFCRKQGADFKYIETSAKTGEGV